jgi:hypothetical protein
MRARGHTGGTATRARLAGVLCALTAGLALLLTTSPPAEAVGTAASSLQTKASPSVSLGGTISDSAQMVGLPGGAGGIGSPPTGTLTFDLYAPGDTTCATPIFTASPALAIQGGVVSTAASGSYTPTASPGGAGSGTYNWRAFYPGDGTYAATSTACGAETVAVTDVTPTLSTVASPGVQAGSGATLTDTATLTGGKAPTGSITFLLFPPSDPTCSGKVVDAKSTVTVVDPNPTVSQPFAPTTPGTYHWIAVYSGDAHNGASNGACSDPNEAVVVTPAPPTPGGPGTTTTPGTTPPPAGSCNAAATAKALLLGIQATLTGGPGAAFSNSCSAGVRIVLRAKEIRPGNKGTPRHDGFTTMANVLTHISPGGPALTFSLNAAGQALRAYSLSHNKSLTAFLVVHVRQDKATTSTESLQILTLG